ncbi:MAG: FliM/FliN family flagellar motor switch protein [Tatlockia sp.]|nr:FliM/FliN family flagellar motor switch protein [Tatlockia sp.]
MKTVFKPYRFISPKELDYFQQNIRHHLENWSQLYALKGLDVELRTAAKSGENSDEKFLLMTEEKKPIALLDKHYLELIKESLFSDYSDCFDSICAEIFMNFLKKILAIDSLLFCHSTHSTDWFYPGSPCLVSQFSSDTKRFNLYLHPDWILAQIPKQKPSLPALAKLDEVLASKEILLTVELEPLKLSLDKLFGLQVGDVIKTSHSISKPMLMRNQQQTLCEVEAGQFQHFKSIQLKRSL